MAAKVSFFRVDCGDMTLVEFDSGKTLLIDCNIRGAADDPDDDTADVAAQLRDRLKRDKDGRPYVDAMLLSHPDQDHCRGIRKHFHLGAPGDYPKSGDKILVREMWSSPLVFRRSSKDHVLCEDAKAWDCEARRRVQLFKDKGYCPDGERILIMGEDEDGKTDDLGDILVKADQTWKKIDGKADDSFQGLLLAPVPAEGDEEEQLTKNESSVVVRFKLKGGAESDACRFLTGGDAEVAVWEKLWDRHGDEADDYFAYDLLLTPHHCSWHSLSHDSWSDCGEDAKVSKQARKALGQARDGAKLIASSKPIKDDDCDPPCIRAKREYDAIADAADGEFICVGDGGPEPLEYEIVSGGLKQVVRAAARVSIIGRQPVGHG